MKTKHETTAQRVVDGWALAKPLEDRTDLVKRFADKLEALDDKWRVHWDQAIRERDSARQEVVAANSVDFWTWQGDGGDHLESMGQMMVVQMTAGNLRAMLTAAGESPSLKAIGTEIMSYLNDHLDMGNCAFCGGNNSCGKHDEGTLCDSLQKALSSEGDGESLESQVQRLANFIMAEVPGEPSQSEGAIDTAIRLLRMVLNK